MANDFPLHDMLDHFKAAASNTAQLKATQQLLNSGDTSQLPAPFLRYDSPATTLHQATEVATLLTESANSVYGSFPELQRFSFFAAKDHRGQTHVRLQLGDTPHYAGQDLAEAFADFSSIHAMMRQSLTNPTHRFFSSPTPQLRMSRHNDIESRLRQAATSSVVTDEQFEALVKEAVNRNVIDKQGFFGKKPLHLALLNQQFKKAAILLSLGNAKVDDEALAYAAQIKNMPAFLDKLLGHQPKRQGMANAAKPGPEQQRDTKQRFSFR